MLFTQWLAAWPAMTTASAASSVWTNCVLRCASAAPSNRDSTSGRSTE